MADRKISDLTALTTPAVGDFLPIVDISEVAAANKNKRITIEELMRGMPDGTAAAPGIAFETDPNTGIYSPGADQLAVATNGTGRLYIASDGKVGIGTTSPGSALEINAAAATSPFIAKINTAEAARIDSSGRLLVGTSSARANYFNSTGTAQFQIEGIGSGAATASLTCNRSITGAVATLTLNKSAGDTVGSNTLVTSDEALGVLTFQGNDGTEFVQAASISAFVDGTPGANDMPGRLVFSTTADGSATPTERMRITSGGQTYWVSSTPSASSFGTSIGRATAGLVETFRNADGTASVLIAGGTAGYARITGDGDLENTNNSYTGISDVKLKENIVDASSQWNDIKALRVRKYNLKAETGFNTHTQIGLIAQETESVCPGLVNTHPDLDEEGNDLGTTTKSVTYSALYMKAVKALQEAMERIETLEAKVAALESA